MTALNNVLNNIKSAALLKATMIALNKIDSDKIVSYIEQYGEKTYQQGKGDFIEFVYYKLLELVSSLNRARSKRA